MKVLVVEDSSRVQDVYRRNCPDGVQLLQARTQMEARQLFPVHRGDIKLIILDGEVPEMDPQGGADMPLAVSTQQLARELRAEFFGRMVAASSLYELSRRLCEDGCDEVRDKSQIHRWFPQELRGWPQPGA